VPPRSRGWFWLFAVPLSAVAVVAVGVVAGGRRPVRCARVFSGPTQGVTELSLRVEVGERDRTIEVPVPGAPFTLAVLDGGQLVAKVAAQSDELGSAEVRVRLPKPRDSALELWVEGTDARAPLARGLVLGRLEQFRRVTRRGGFQGGHRTGDIELSVAPAHGVLITTQGAPDDELVILARHAGAPLAGARIRLQLEGAEPAAVEQKTDALGVARVRIAPREPTLRIEAHAKADGVGEGGLTSRLDALRGAIRVTREGDKLRLASGGAANRAFLGFFDSDRRYTGVHTELTLAPSGNLVGEVPWPAGLTASPLWVVASSQPDLGSPAAVGWPVVGASALDPQTFDARELLLLDGAPLAERREERRERRVRWITAGYTVMALLLTLLLVARRVRDSERRVAQHLSRAGIDDEDHGIAPLTSGWGAVAASCIALGFVVLALLALLKE
jgi:hypothetical protein